MLVSTLALHMMVMEILLDILLGGNQDPVGTELYLERPNTFMEQAVNSIIQVMLVLLRLI